MLTSAAAFGYARLAATILAGAGNHGGRNVVTALSEFLSSGPVDPKPTVYAVTLLGRADHNGMDGASMLFLRQRWSIDAVSLRALTRIPVILESRAGLTGCMRLARHLGPAALQNAGRTPPAEGGPPTTGRRRGSQTADRRPRGLAPPERRRSDRTESAERHPL